MRRLVQKSVSLVPWRARVLIKRLPLIAPFQRWLLGRFLEGGEFIHRVDGGPARGLNYPIRLPQDKGIWTGTYELEFSTLLSKAIRPGDVCLDLGGWRGFFSGVMALAGALRVFVFEPLPENCAQIRRLLQLNPRLPIELIEAAVGEAESKLEFDLMPESSMGKLAISPFQIETKGKDQIQVRVVSLDGLLATGKIQRPAVIKMDVEGAELLALRGARRLLAEHKPKLFLEIHSRELAVECQRVLAGLGYRISVVETGRGPDGVSEPAVCHFAAV